VCIYRIFVWHQIIMVLSYQTLLLYAFNMVNKIVLMLKNTKSSFTMRVAAIRIAATLNYIYGCILWVHLFESSLINLKIRAVRKVPVWLYTDKGFNWGLWCYQLEALESWDRILQNYVYVHYICACKRTMYSYISPMVIWQW
jgi:hypothetical protein